MLDSLHDCVPMVDLHSRALSLRPRLALELFRHRLGTQRDRPRAYGTERAFLEHRE